MRPGRSIAAPELDAGHLLADLTVLERTAAEGARSMTEITASLTQFAAAVSEISVNTDEVKDVLAVAVRESDELGPVVNRLVTAVTQIGNVTRLIADIARQTNLLSLNAAIEAARAGDAGRGFSVVANEVKELAGSTGDATHQIEGTIRQIEGDTSQAVEAIGRIVTTINEVAALQSFIQAAASEQSAVARDVTALVHGATSRATTIAETVQQLTAGATPGHPTHR